MDYRKLPENSEYDCEIQFDPDQEEIIRTVYRAKIVTIGRMGKTGLITQQDEQLSELGLDESHAAQRFNNVSDIIDELRLFHQDTQDVVKLIVSDIPAQERKSLGRAALGLAKAISREALPAVETGGGKMTAGEQAARFEKEVMSDLAALPIATFSTRDNP